MDEKEPVEWLEKRGEMILSKQDDKGSVAVTRTADDIWKTAEAEALERAVIMWEEM